MTTPRKHPLLLTAAVLLGACASSSSEDGDTVSGVPSSMTSEAPNTSPNPASPPGDDPEATESPTEQPPTPSATDSSTDVPANPGAAGGGAPAIQTPNPTASQGGAFAGGSGGDGVSPSLGGQPGDGLGGASSLAGGGGEAGSVSENNGGRSVEPGAAGAPSEDPGLGPLVPDTGPGGPQVSFGADDLFDVCSYIDGGPSDQDHHNTAAMYDGYLVLPWAHEAGGGGVSFYDISDPCSPERISLGTSAEMRETHTVAISNLGGRWLFAAQKETGSGAGGLQVWDISDVTEPKVFSKAGIPGHSYPNAYDYVTMATAPQGRYLYVAAGFLGFFVVDISNPASLEIVAEYQTNPGLRTQEVIVVGNLLFSSAAEGARVVLLDISNPTEPTPIGGADFNLRPGGTQSDAYSGNVNGGYAYFARQSGTGGVIIYDIKDPSNPTFVGDYNDSGGNGGYVFFQAPHLFVGNSNFFSVYDATNLSDISLVNRLQLTGDQDTITPFGNVALLSVDASANADRASAIAPWSTEVDSTPPSVNWVYPPSGSSGIARSSRIGVTFTEAVTYTSAWRPGAVRMYPTDLGPAASIAAHIDVMDTVVNLSPVEPLAAATEYTFEVVPGGVQDNVGNAVTEAFSATFTTGG